MNLNNFNAKNIIDKILKRKNILHQYNTCIRFAELLAKQYGMTYAEATKKYPRGPHKNTCYKNYYEYVEGHCVHCARVEAMNYGEDK